LTHPDKAHLFKDVHGEGVDLRQETEDENEREEQDEHVDPVLGEAEVLFGRKLDSVEREGVQAVAAIGSGLKGQGEAATEDEVNRPTEDDDPVDAVRRAGAVRLDRLEQGVLAAGGDDAEEEEADVLVVALLEDEAAEDADEDGQEDGEQVFEGRHVPVENGEQRQPVERDPDGELGQDLEAVKLLDFWRQHLREDVAFAAAAVRRRSHVDGRAEDAVHVDGESRMAAESQLVLAS